MFLGMAGKLVYSKTILSVYLSCLVLFFAVLVTDGNQSLKQKFLHPLDESYSILGTRSVFKDYLGGQKLYAFLPYWSLHADLMTDYLTDLSYFGLTIDSTARIVTTDGPYKKWRNDEVLARVVEEVQTAGGRVSVTLICHNDDDIDAVLSCPSCWEKLAEDVIKELSWAGIKDLNVDFEHSGYTTYENAQKYSQMVGLLNTRLDQVFGESFVVVSAYADSADRAQRAQGDGSDDKASNVRLTDPSSLAQNADAVFIMAYDFHRPTSDKAGPVSPLGGSYTTTRLNLSKSLESYLKVVPASKLILGLPFYGYDWLVEDTGAMSPRVEGNDSIGFSKSRTYAQVLDLLVEKQIQPLWHKDSETPYFNYTDDETGMLRQVWYDDAKSLTIKADLAKQNGLLGVGLWALGFEGGYSDIWKAFRAD